MDELRFPAIQEELYRAEVRHSRELDRIKERYRLTVLPKCIYPLWHSLKGRGKLGEFPLMVVRKHYTDKGYTVWASDSNEDPKDVFILVSFPGLRKLTPPHPAYERMVKIFGQKKIEELNKITDEAKAQGKDMRNLGGGDPDLFVFKGANAEVERFFVEVKHKDKPTQNQEICFPLIEGSLHCEVKLIRIVADEKLDIK
jgi:hypothetical protein